MAMKRIEGNRQDNSMPSRKIKIRKYFLDKIDEPRILDVYGSYGMMYKKLYSQYEIYKGYKKKEHINLDDYNYFDFDSYSDPNYAIDMLLPLLKKRIAIILTDCAVKLRVCGKVLKRFEGINLEDGSHLYKQFPKIWYQYLGQFGKVSDFKWINNKHSTFYIGCFLDPLGKR